MLYNVQLHPESKPHIRTSHRAAQQGRVLLDVLLVVVMIINVTFLFQTFIRTGSQDDDDADADFPKRGSSLNVVEEELQSQHIEEMQGCEASQVQILQEHCIP